MKNQSSMHDTSSHRSRSERKTSKSSQRKKSLFGRKPKHESYAIRYHFNSVSGAKESANFAVKKFHEDNRRDAKDLIKYMTVFAANKAQAMSENRRLNEPERKKFREIHEIYKKAYQKMVLPERKHEYKHKDSDRHKKSKFPKHPQKGERHSIIRNVKGRRRRLTFEATGQKGNFHGKPKWVMIANEEA